MRHFDHFYRDEIVDRGFLADYRATVDRLHDETVAEFGRQPMAPEKASMIAVALACMPLAALMLPAVPIEPHVWQIGLVELAVWLATFKVQAWRYDRFQARWADKLAAHDPVGA